MLKLIPAVLLLSSLLILNGCINIQYDGISDPRYWLLCRY